jgi:hypothetical protein
MDFSNLLNNQKTVVKLIENSFKNDIELYQSLDKTINKYNKNVFSRFILENNYEKYLKNLSKNNSLDDISIIFLRLLNK